jgi:hypothetical protein
MNQTSNVESQWQIQALELQKIINIGIKIKGGDFSECLIWDVIALYMKLRNTSEFGDLEIIKRYLNNLPGIDLAKLELQLLEATNQHGYLVHCKSYN